MGCIQITKLPLQQPRSNILRVLRLHSHNLLLQIKPDRSHTQGRYKMGNFNNKICILILFPQRMKIQDFSLIFQFSVFFSHWTNQKICGMLKMILNAYITGKPGCFVNSK